MSKKINHGKLKKAKRSALAEAKRLCRGKPDRVRHQVFIQLWESNLATLLREA
ncbi:MAG: hypothetical protein IJE19_03420 [Clostridia bacterium]|nr:hypothetical protein [Clostridia bacterium]